MSGIVCVHEGAGLCRACERDLFRQQLEALKSTITEQGNLRDMRAWASTAPLADRPEWAEHVAAAEVLLAFMDAAEAARS